MGNGFAITAIVGKAKIMKNAKETFISSTFWSERIGFVAAIETLKFMKKRTWLKISKIGDQIKELGLKFLKNMVMMFQYQELDRFLVSVLIKK